MSEFDLGRHEALIERLVLGQEKLMADVEAIKQHLAEQRAERRLLASAWGVVGGVLAGLLTMVVKGWFGLRT